MNIPQNIQILLDNNTLPPRLILSGAEGFSLCVAITARVHGVTIDKIMSGSHSDTLMIMGDSSIKVGDTKGGSDGVTARDIAAWCANTPMESAARVVLVERIERLTNAAANALLKLIEEPPKHVRFIASTDNQYQLPETIRSRMTVITVGNSAATEMSEMALSILNGDKLKAFALIEKIHKGEDSRVVAKNLIVELMHYMRIKDPKQLPILQKAHQHLQENASIRTTLEWMVLRINNC